MAGRNPSAASAKTRKKRKPTSRKAKDRRADPGSILIGIHEVSALADLHPSSVRRLCAQNSFPSPKKFGDGGPGTAHRWIRAEVEQFLRSKGPA